MLRITAIMNRAGGREKTGRTHKNEIIELEGLKVDVTARIVCVDGKRVEMSPKEYELFFYLLRNRNIALSREKLISDVWGYDFFGDDRTLGTHIKLLRKSLGPYSKFIVTLRGVGYRFETP
jgi:DNA-binding response OmpR family regulator